LERHPRWENSLDAQQMPVGRHPEWFIGRKIVTKTTLLKSTVFAAAGLGLMAFASAASAADVGACLITKTDTNPFFVKMKEGASAKAKEIGVDLKSYAGKAEGDNEGQVAAIESCIADGAKGILITATDTAAITKRRGVRVMRMGPPEGAREGRPHQFGPGAGKCKETPREDWVNAARSSAGSLVASSIRVVGRFAARV